MPGGVVVPPSGTSKAESESQRASQTALNRGFPFKVWQPTEGFESPRRAAASPDSAQRGLDRRRSGSRGADGLEGSRRADELSVSTPSRGPGLDGSVRGGELEEAKRTPGREGGGAKARGPSGAWVKSGRLGGSGGGKLGSKTWHGGAVTGPGVTSETDESLDSDEASSDEEDDVVLHR